MPALLLSVAISEKEVTETQEVCALVEPPVI
jgi:hypothetical protein